MKTILCIAALVFLLLSLIPFLQARKRVGSWKDRPNEPVGDEDASFIEGRMKIYTVLFTIAMVLCILGILWDMISPILA